MPDVMPILPSWDFDVTSAFYRKLGFDEGARFPDSYLIMDHPAGIELHFFQSPEFPAERNDHGAYVRFATAAEADALHEAWGSKDVRAGRLFEPADTDYGLREFALLDPMRNLLRVGGFLGS